MALPPSYSSVPQGLAEMGDAYRLRRRRRHIGDSFTMRYFSSFFRLRFGISLVVVGRLPRRPGYRQLHCREFRQTRYRRFDDVSQARCHSRGRIARDNISVPLARYYAGGSFTVRIRLCVYSDFYFSRRGVSLMRLTFALHGNAY